MIKPSPRVPMSHTAIALVLSTYMGASEDDAVRTVETDGFHTHTYSDCWPRTQSEYMLQRVHADDHALACALASHMPEWPEHTTLDLYAVRDQYGTWCVECGNSVVSGPHGHACTAPGCDNYDLSRLPEWARPIPNYHQPLIDT